MEQRRRSAKEIRAYPERCSGCISCQLACSFTHTKSFNPSKSRILINFVGDLERQISFTEECIRCGTCVRYCNYDALEIVKTTTEE